MELPSVSVIVATWRREEALALVLGDLARQVGVEAEVVVVDQNDPPMREAVYARFRESGHGLRVLHREPGVVAARNAGAAVSKGVVVVFIDDDVRIDDGHFLARHARNYLDAGLAGVCGQELSPPDYRASAVKAPVFADAFEEAMFFPRASSERREVFHLVTCNCSIRRTAWEQVGGLDMLYAGNSYGDDYDLALRMRAAGLRLVFDPGPSVRHTHAPMGGLRLADPRNSFTEAEKYVSLWRFFFRHVPPGWRGWYLHNAILRKSLLLRRNAMRPWRWPAIVAGLVLSCAQARAAERGGLRVEG